MRKIVLLIIPLLFWGCEKTFDNLIDVTQDNYQVTTVSHKDSVDLKNPADSLLTIRMIFAPGSELNRASFDIYASDDSKLNSSPVEFNKINETLFQNTFLLKPEFPNGIYNIRYNVTGTSGVTKEAAQSSFHFNNGQDNLPPVISNTVIEPDTAVVNDTTVIFTSVEAMDPNGAADIVEVHFIVYRPDGTTNGSKVFLFDDGNTIENGDLVAGDGIYSRLIQVNQNNAKGLYRFEFQAEDRSGELSNIINHFVLIQ